MSGKQLQKVLEGLPPEQLEFRANPVMMSNRELLGHLVDTYRAYVAERDGRTYEWGSFSPAGLSAEDLGSAYVESRTGALAAAQAATTNEALVSGLGFIVLHDGYHIGQFCANRMAADPNWNPYVIYED